MHWICFAKATAIVEQMRGRRYTASNAMPERLPYTPEANMKPQGDGRVK